MLVQVAEAGALPTAERVVGDRNGDRNIDADHTNLHAGREVASGIAVAGEDGDAVAVLVIARQTQRLFVVVRADDLQDGSEDLFLIIRISLVTLSKSVAPVKKPPSAPATV